MYGKVKKVLGISCGVDIVEIDRIKKGIERLGDTFKRKIFSMNEINYCEKNKAHMYERYAVRFAAKEAISKALGTGIRGGISFKTIEVINDEFGRPSAILHGMAKDVYNQKRFTEISLSLSHCKLYAVAYAVILSSDFDR